MHNYRVSLVLPAVTALVEIKDHRAHQARQVHVVCKERRENKVFVETRATRETEERLAYQVHLDQMVCQDRQGPRAAGEIVVLLEEMEILAHLDLMDCRDLGYVRSRPFY